MKNHGKSFLFFSFLFFSGVVFAEVPDDKVWKRRALSRKEEPLDLTSSKLSLAKSESGTEEELLEKVEQRKKLGKEINGLITSLQTERTERLEEVSDSKKTPECDQAISDLNTHFPNVREGWVEYINTFHNALTHKQDKQDKQQRKIPAIESTLINDTASFLAKYFKAKQDRNCPVDFQSLPFSKIFQNPYKLPNLLEEYYKTLGVKKKKDEKYPIEDQLEELDKKLGLQLDSSTQECHNQPALMSSSAVPKTAWWKRVIEMLKKRGSFQEKESP